MEDRRGQAYNEEAFRYFLALERHRSRRSGRAFVLLLVELTAQPGASARIDPDVVSELFSALSLCLRETDFVGWYREESVAGAVLTELGDRARADVCRLVGQRVSGALGERLPSSTARRLQVRVYQHPEVDGLDSRGGVQSVV